MRALLRVSDCHPRFVGDTYSHQRITPEQHPHNFVKITDPQALIIKHYRREHHPARCDGCQKKIIGTRYKVTHQPYSLQTFVVTFILVHGLPRLRSVREM